MQGELSNVISIYYVEEENNYINSDIQSSADSVAAIRNVGPGEVCFRGAGVIVGISIMFGNFFRMKNDSNYFCSGSFDFPG